MSALRARVPFWLRSLAKIARAQVFFALRSERFAFPALYDMDRTLLSLMPRAGTFLEIGANDGYSQSNTYALERLRGWDGILIEPLPKLFRLCRLHRRRSKCFNVACVGPDGPSSLRLVDLGLETLGLGVLDSTEERFRMRNGRKEVNVPTATLSGVIDEAGYQRVTLMSIDVEGAELDVLAGLDFDRHCPDFLLIECDKFDALEAVLKPRMELITSLSFHDYLFGRR